MTVADFCAQAVISDHIASAFPEDPIVGEEDANLLKDAESPLVRDILRSLESAVPSISHRRLLDLINKCSYDPLLENAANEKKRFWTVDPVDGTKGFIRQGGQGQYAVCLALIDSDGQVAVAVLGCPNLPIGDVSDKCGSSKGMLFAARLGEQSFRQVLFPSEQEEEPPRHLISVNKQLSQLNQVRFCESFEEKHSDHSLSNEIRSQLGITAVDNHHESGEPLRLDSQCKYGIVSSGQADCYIRLPLVQSQTGKKYVEKIWDHAAGDLLVRQAGGVVTDMLGRRLDYSHGRLLRGNCGVLASANRVVHDAIVNIYTQLESQNGKLSFIHV